MLLATVAIACLGNYILRAVVVVHLIIIYRIGPNPSSVPGGPGVKWSKSAWRERAWNKSAWSKSGMWISFGIWIRWVYLQLLLICIQYNPHTTLMPKQTPARSTVHVQGSCVFTGIAQLRYRSWLPISIDIFLSQRYRTDIRSHDRR